MNTVFLHCQIRLHDYMLYQNSNDSEVTMVCRDIAITYWLKVTGISYNTKRSCGVSTEHYIQPDITNWCIPKNDGTNVCMSYCCWLIYNNNIKIMHLGKCYIQFQVKVFCTLRYPMVLAVTTSILHYIHIYIYIYILVYI